MDTKKSNELGASSSFLLVGLVLVVLVTGGIYFVQQRGQDEKAPQPTSGSTSNEKKAKPDEKPRNTNSSAGEGSRSHSDSNLPESGPTENMLAVIISGILAASITAYARSARDTREYLKS